MGTSTERAILHYHRNGFKVWAIANYLGLPESQVIRVLKSHRCGRYRPAPTREEINRKRRERQRAARAAYIEELIAKRKRNDLLRH